MEYLFPIPSPYEIVDHSFLNLSYNVVYTMDKLIKISDKKILNMISKEECLYLGVNIIIFFMLISFKINYRAIFENEYTF